MTGSPLILDVRDLVKHLPVKGGGVLRRSTGRLRTVDGVNLELRRGETLGLVGESGCGKSSLARLLTAVDRPTSGEIRLFGERLDQLRGSRLRAARRRIKLVFQDPYASLDPRMTVEALVREPFLIHRDVAPRGEHRRLVRELLELVGLNPDHARRYPHQFSGGQRQRVAIARALALRPEILVCDEPVSALDVSVQAQIVNLFTSLQRELGIAYVFIAHDLSVVEHIADRVAVMYLGRIVEEGTVEEVYDGPRHPYTEALLSAVPDPVPDASRPPARVRLQGDVPSPLDPPSGCRFRTRCPRAAEKCATEEPPLHPGSTTASAHAAACHFPLQPATPRDPAEV